MSKFALSAPLGAVALATGLALATPAVAAADDALLLPASVRSVVLHAGGGEGEPKRDKRAERGELKKGKGVGSRHLSPLLVPPLTPPSLTRTLTTAQSTPVAARQPPAAQNARKRTVASASRSSGSRGRPARVSRRSGM